MRVSNRGRGLSAHAAIVSTLPPRGQKICPPYEGAWRGRVERAGFICPHGNCPNAATIHRRPGEQPQGLRRAGTQSFVPTDSTHLSQKQKNQHWRGVQGNLPREGAPMLVFGVRLHDYFPIVEWPGFTYPRLARFTVLKAPCLPMPIHTRCRSLHCQMTAWFNRQRTVPIGAFAETRASRMRRFT